MSKVNLPEWIKTIALLDHATDWDEKKLLQALTIAWEALDAISEHDPHIWEFKRARAQDAMRRIEELGK